jgi:hypothetical protein
VALIEVGEEIFGHDGLVKIYHMRSGTASSWWVALSRCDTVDRKYSTRRCRYISCLILGRKVEEVMLCLVNYRGGCKEYRAGGFIFASLHPVGLLLVVYPT